MTDKNRTLAVRVALGLLMAVTGGCMLVGCPVKAGPPLHLRGAVSSTVHADSWPACNSVPVRSGKAR